MSSLVFTANAWPYVRAELQPHERSVAALAQRTVALGFDGFDLMVGPDSFPEVALADALPVIRQARDVVESEGGRIASVVLVGLGLQDMDEASQLLAAGPELCAVAGTRLLNTLPRKVGITHDEGFARLNQLWATHGPALIDAGLTVTAENHALQLPPDDDIFLIRTSDDFQRLVEITSGGIRVKYDPAWLLFGGQSNVTAPLAALAPHVEVLDVKDFNAGRFVTPGTGDVPFGELFKQLGSVCASVSVEVEEHHFPPEGQAEETQAAAIDQLQCDALGFYKQWSAAS